MVLLEPALETLSPALGFIMHRINSKPLVQIQKKHLASPAHHYSNQEMPRQARNINTETIECKCVMTKKQPIGWFHKSRSFSFFNELISLYIDYDLWGKLL